MNARDMLDKLVGFDTVSRNSNLPLIDFVEDYLAGHGAKSVRVPDPTGTKAALYAHIGPQVDGAIVLSGHTDVVPVDGQAWDTDPFVVMEKDGKLYGRGTADMKGFCALALAAVPLALEKGIKRPLQIALSYDEEVGCLGAPPMIDHMVASGLPRGNAVIVGEPSMMQVVTGHKGGFGFKLHFQGFEVHSSIAYQGVSAIMMAAKFIEWANQVNAESAAAIPNEINAVFDPPYTSLHFGTITGGTANNITAKDCHVTMDVRLVPGDDGQAWRDRIHAKLSEIETQMKAVQPTCAIVAEPFFGIPPLSPETNGTAEELARRLTGDNGTHVVSYGTEGGQFQERGFSTVVCGPGDIAQAHQPNEFITVDQFEQGEAFLARLIDHLAS
ncbi:acetylornithine deacetylase [Yoonia sp. 208BN28-4]|uniref:acetylornithine deacetylase n=1 Tax=Yoonia sp. 208BN28-4 TaxID=3126505 RepID=UPI0030AC7629